MTRCLIDADVVTYQIASMGQHKDDEGEIVVHHFDSVAEQADQLIWTIQEMCLADEPSLLFFTGDEKLIAYENSIRNITGDDLLVYSPNFRHALSTSKVYKGTRVQEKPYHFDNLRLYLLTNYPHKISIGREADDDICIELTKDKSAIACSRDKDLKQVPGMHFTWPCGKQEQWGPHLVDELGELHLDGKKCKGTGEKFFYAQMIIGDSTDNIPGVPKSGDKKAYGLLANCETVVQCHEAVVSLYKEKKLSREYFKEQWSLLRMIRTEDEWNELILRRNEEERYRAWEGQQVPLTNVMETGRQQSSTPS